MHVHFHGLTASKTLQKTFTSHGIRYSTGKPATDFSPDLCLFRLKSTKDFTQLAQWRRRYTRCWIALLVGEAELKDAELYTAVLNSPDKDSVWHLDTWESLLWFSIQELTRSRRFEKDLEESHKSMNTLVHKLEKDLHVAEKIQEKLVRGTGPQIPGVELITKYIAAPGLGGDYFDIFEIQEGHKFGILLVDSETHGLVAALLSILLKLKVDNFKHQFESPEAFVNHLERELADAANGALDQISLFFGILDRKTLELQYASRGHISPMLWRKGKRQPFNDQLIPGDTIFLCTNGLYRILGNETHLVSIFSQMKEPLSLSQLKNILMGKIDAFMDQDKLEDDITFVEIGIHPNALVLKKTS